MRTAAVGSFISIRIMHDAERSDMRITSVSAYPIAIPYRVPWRNRHTEDSGRPMTHLETTILEVRTQTRGSAGWVKRRDWMSPSRFASNSNRR